MRSRLTTIELKYRPEIAVHPTRSLARLLLCLFAAVLLAACSGARRTSELDLTLMSYESSVRWGDFEGAWAMVDPEYKEKHPLSSTDWERFKQIRVAGYRASGHSEIEEGKVAQAVEVEVINVHTQTPRLVVDRQIWKWDPEAKRWWLTTGLPDITQR